ncbi:MAG TPA: ATP-binding protein [Tepidisphaeraceae bacterium]|jgi:signal transduction histidine kinase/pSer/pThr/pTyr-binding forkhead associated (FHA) protein|nr:ATP-binding protein [Tepidisphaeraceae bacterium]
MFVLTLLVLQGPDKGRRFELPDAPALVGRDSRQLPLTDNTVSRRHCELLPADGSWIVHDMGSANGTYVNGARVDKQIGLKIGDQVRVGRTLMVFGAQPGVSRTSGKNVALSGEEAGMDSAIMATVPSSEDSMVLAVPEPAAAAMGNLKILYQLGAALGSSFSVDQVLEVVMDLSFEHVKADRGIILLLDTKNNELVPKVVRTRDEPAAKSAEPLLDGKPAVPEKIHASRTIINHVLQTGEGVLSSNAMTDQRFSKGKSVHNLGIRSALCVPIKARKLTDKGGDEVIGLIYIDSSVRNYTYAPEQLRLLTAIGLQAGMAIQNAELYQAQLQAERLAAVGETSAALSHSIKNILQALQGGADVVEMGLRGSNITQASKGWRIVHRNLDKIYGLTMNLLAYSKQREPSLEMVNPKKLIDECLELVAQGANEKGVMVVGDVDEGHPAIPMDPSGMHQVIMNLLSNALDAVRPNTGLVRAACHYDETNRQAVIEVVDNGSGVAPSMMKHMFELFHSTKGNRGTGLGLAVAKKIVEEHEGAISVKSAPGEGTKFTIRLPVFHTNLTDPSQTHGPSAR